YTQNHKSAAAAVARPYSILELCTRNVCSFNGIIIMAFAFFVIIKMQLWLKSN
ncbi:hypothetical protein ACJX0J_021779, partial [Zea mays]